MTSTPTHSPPVGTDRRAKELPQYSFRRILAVWAAATIPMSVLGWIIAPFQSTWMGLITHTAPSFLTVSVVAALVF